MLIPEAGTAEAQDRAASLQQGARAFAALYERNAYLVYNLTLRVTCDRRAAIVTASASFLAAGTNPEAERGLAKTATSQALALAADRVATPNGAGDAEAESMLAATATLSPPERAALALHGLAEATPEAIGEAMGLAEQAAAALLERSFEGLARGLRKGRTEAEEAYAAWLWAAPPDELWADLYPSYHRLLERRLREGERDGAASADSAAAAGPHKGPSRRERRRARRAQSTAVAAAAGGKPRRRRRLGRRALWALAVLAVAGGGYAVASGTGLVGGSDQPAPESPLAPEQSFGGGLSPEKLDELRLRELERSGGGSAADDEGEDAEPEDPEDRARARKLAAKRKRAKELARRRAKLAKRRRELRERASRSTPAASPDRSPRRETRDRSPSSRDDSKRDSKNPPKDEDGRSIEDCLYHADEGTYVCPD